MQCPYCKKEIDDDASFCGFCGKATSVPQKVPSSLLEGRATAEGIEKKNTESVDSKALWHKQKKKRRRGWKVLLVFVLLAFIGGSTLGFLRAKDLFPPTPLTSGSTFRWTSFSERETEESVQETTVGEEEKKQSSK